MGRFFSPRAFARRSARHPWLVLAMWLVFLVAGGFSAMHLGDVISGDTHYTSKPEAIKASDLIKEGFAGQHTATDETVVIQSSQYLTTDPEFRAVAEKAAEDLRAMPAVVKTVVNPYELDPAQAAAMVSKDGHILIMPVTFTQAAVNNDSDGALYVAQIGREGGSGVTVLSAGSASANQAFDKIANDDLAKSEIVGMPAALVILVVVFGALLAAGLPILLGVISIVIAIGLAAILGRFMSLDSTVANMISMIGLAVGIDYSLFVIERYREERRNGHLKRDAIELAGATAGKAVLFSGFTVIVALCGMLLMPISDFQGLGAGAILAVIVAIFGTLTLIPALLSLLGDKINWPRRRAIVPQAAANTSRGGFWGITTRLVMWKPVFFTLIAGAGLILLASPAFSLKTGEPGLDTLPKSDVKTAYQILSANFYAGADSPINIVIDGKASDPKTTAAIQQLNAALAGQSQLGAASITTNAAGDLTVISAPTVDDMLSDPVIAEVHTIRKTLVPAAFHGVDAKVYVGGDTAENVDLNAMMDRYQPLVIAFVLTFSFILLMVAFRSLVAPITAIVMNLLSVGSAYGLLVLVFQRGHGASALGLTRAPVIEAWVPLFLFCVLFGLSMDYHVFLLSRIRENYDRTGRNAESVAAGLQSTAKIITGAALIMVVVFGAFAAGRLVAMQQMGFGLAAAVLIDATVIRSILVPAVMRILGDWNWWLPTRLSWLPDVRIEGRAQPAAAPAD